MSKHSPDTGCCPEFEELIQKRLDGDISSGENELLNSHLADCERCRDELVSLSMVQSLLKDSLQEEVKVPEGFFEGLAEELERREAVRGFARFLGFLRGGAQRNLSFAAVSVFLVAALSISVIQGLSGRALYDSGSPAPVSRNFGFIHTNSGDVIYVPTDELTAEEYAAALHDLERAYREAYGEGKNSETQGYIRTSWRGNNYSSPIH